MTRRIDAVLSPAELGGPAFRDLAGTACVVFDVLRATSSIVAALAAGAARVIPVSEIEDALAYRREDPDVLLAGERGGVRIEASLASGTDFDLGNSPREYAAERVRGRTIVTTTTNGTRALAACRGADHVFAACLLNLGATAAWIESLPARRVLLVCAGTYDEVALEDVFAAGGLCDALGDAEPSDAALTARTLWRTHANHPLALLSSSRNGRRLRGIPELAPDVEFCAAVDAVPIVVRADRQGALRRVGLEPNSRR